MSANNLAVIEGGAAGVRDAMMPRTFAEVVRFAEMIAPTTFAPAAFKNKPHEIVAAVTYGAEVGLNPMQSIRSIAVINGTPALFGDGLLAVCQSHPQWAGKEERYEGDGETLTAICTVKRRGEPDITSSFSMQDAKKAQLAGKQGPWQQYPKRMLMMRARGFALRDQFADALRGLISEAEARDYPVGPDRARDITPAADRRARMEALDEPELVTFVDADGEEHLLAPAEAEQTVREAAKAATPEQFEAMLELNAQAPDVKRTLHNAREEVAKPSAFWSRPRLTIPVNGGGIEAWSGRMERAIKDAPDADRLARLRDDNADGFEELRDKVPAVAEALLDAIQEGLVRMEDA